jgi:hypothetical protein
MSLLFPRSFFHERTSLGVKLRGSSPEDLERALFAAALADFCIRPSVASEEMTGKGQGSENETSNQKLVDESYVGLKEDRNSITGAEPPSQEKENDDRGEVGEGFGQVAARLALNGDHDRKEVERELHKVVLPPDFKLVLTGLGRVGNGAREIVKLLNIYQI